MLGQLLRLVGPGGVPFLEYLGLGLKGGTDEALTTNSVLVIENANSPNPQVTVQPRSDAVLTRTQVVELGLEKARLLPHAVGSAVSTSPQIAYELVKPILDLSNAAGSNFRRGDLPRVTGRETQPSLAELIEDFIAGANVQSGFPNPPPFMQPGLLAPIEAEFLQQLGQAAAGFLSQVWDLFNSRTAGPGTWASNPDIFDVSTSGSIGVNGATATVAVTRWGTPTTNNISDGCTINGVSQSWGTSCQYKQGPCTPTYQLTLSAGETLEIVTSDQAVRSVCGGSYVPKSFVLRVRKTDGTLYPTSNGPKYVGITSGQFVIIQNFAFNITFNPIGAVVGSWESAFPAGVPVPAAVGPYVPPTPSEATAFNEPTVEPDTAPSFVAGQAAQQEQLSNQATTTTVASSQQTISGESPATAVPTVTPSLAPVPAYLPAIGTVLGTQTGTLPQTQSQAVPTTPATAVKIGNSLFDGATAATSAVAVAQELLRIEKKLEAIMQPGDTPDIPWLNILEQIANALSVLSTGNTYRLMEVCPPQGQAPAEYEWEVPGVPLANLGVAARLDALAEMLQVHKDLKQPVCRTVPQGQPVQVNFIQSELEWEPPP